MKRRFLIQLDTENTTDVFPTALVACGLDQLRNRVVHFVDGAENALGVQLDGRVLGYSGACNVQMEELDLTASVVNPLTDFAKLTASQRRDLQVLTQPEPEPTVTDLNKLLPKHLAWICAACRYVEGKLQYGGFDRVGMGAEAVIATNAGLYDEPTADDYAELGDVFAGMPSALPQPAQTPEPSEADKALIEKARKIHGEEGEIEIDDNAVVSRGDDSGAYVAAWVWVPYIVDDSDDSLETEDEGEAFATGDRRQRPD